MPWGVAASVAGAVVTSSLSDSGGGGGGGGNAVQAADPFAAYRAKFADQLSGSADAGIMAGNYQLTGQKINKLISDPSSFLQDPLYQAQLNQGQQSVNRTLSARGQTVSGNELTALQDYGTSSANSYLNNTLSSLSGLNNQFYTQLAQLSGAGQGNLGAASAAQQNANGQYNQLGQSLGQLAGQGVNSLGNYFGSSGTGDNGYAGESFSSNPYTGGVSYGGLGSGYFGLT